MIRIKRRRRGKGRRRRAGERTHQNFGDVPQAAAVNKKYMLHRQRATSGTVMPPAIAFSSLTAPVVDPSKNIIYYSQQTLLIPLLQTTVLYSDYLYYWRKAIRSQAPSRAFPPPQSRRTTPTAAAATKHNCHKPLRR